VRTPSLRASFGIQAPVAMTTESASSRSPFDSATTGRRVEDTSVTSSPMISSAPRATTASPSASTKGAGSKKRWPSSR